MFSRICNAAEASYRICNAIPYGPVNHFKLKL